MNSDKLHLVGRVHKATMEEHNDVVKHKKNKRYMNEQFMHIPERRWAQCYVLLLR